MGHSNQITKSFSDLFFEIRKKLTYIFKGDHLIDPKPLQLAKAVPIWNRDNIWKHLKLSLASRVIIFLLAPLHFRVLSVPNKSL